MPILFSFRTSRRKILRSKDFRLNPTEAEKRLWNQLRAHRLNGLHFRRQAVIDPYIVDFYCHAARLVIEIDGEIHLQQKEMDADRDRFLESLGLHVIHIPNEIVLGNETETISIIQGACRSRMQGEDVISIQK